jgi:hypothetical protein
MRSTIPEITSQSNQGGRRAGQWCPQVSSPSPRRGRLEGADDEAEADDRAVRQEIDRAEQDRIPSQAVRGVQKVRSDEVMRILRQLHPGQEHGQVADPVRRHEQQQQSTEQLDCTIQTLPDDPDLKNTIQPADDRGWSWTERRD